MFNMSAVRFLVRFFMICVFLSGCAGISVVCTRYFWDGNFEQTEYRFTFTDRSGKPLQGVELLVTDGDSNPFPEYPITDYLPGNPLRSDVNGQLVCHHVCFGSEFGGRAYRLFWLIPMGDTSPVFRCRFVLRGQEVGSCSFRDLSSHGSRTKYIVQSWTLRHDASEILKPSRAQRAVFGDRNGDGVVSSAEMAARNAMADAVQRYLDRKKRGLDLVEKRRFRVVKRTVVLDQGENSQE